MGYQDCPCFKCDHGGEREKRIECRRKCTEFAAWKLSMQAIRQKRKVLQKKPDEAKRWKKDMVDPCKACAEINCMGICADQVQYKQEYQEMTDRIRQQIINRNRRGERGQERTDPIL